MSVVASVVGVGTVVVSMPISKMTFVVSASVSIEVVRICLSIRLRGRSCLSSCLSRPLSIIVSGVASIVGVGTVVVSMAICEMSIVSMVEVVRISFSRSNSFRRSLGLSSCLSRPLSIIVSVVAAIVGVGTAVVSMAIGKMPVVSIVEEVRISFSYSNSFRRGTCLSNSLS